MAQLITSRKPQHGDYVARVEFRFKLSSIFSKIPKVRGYKSHQLVYDSKPTKKQVLRDMFKGNEDFFKRRVIISEYTPNEVGNVISK